MTIFLFLNLPPSCGPPCRLLQNDLPYSMCNIGGHACSLWNVSIWLISHWLLSFTKLLILTLVHNIISLSYCACNFLRISRCFTSLFIRNLIMYCYTIAADTLLATVIAGAALPAANMLGMQLLLVCYRQKSLSTLNEPCMCSELFWH